MRGAVAGLVLLLLLLVPGAAFWWVDQPLVLDNPPVDLSIEPGTNARGAAAAVVLSGARVREELLYAWFRVSGQDRLIKAGSYELEAGTTPAFAARHGLV